MAATLVSRRKGKRSRHVMSEINVTPMVDVMLVLLIIFMVTAPLLTTGIEIELPQTKAKSLTRSEEPLVITINASGEIFLQETRIERDRLLPRLVAITKNNRDATLYIRGDRALDYGRVMQVMGDLNDAGFVKIALIAEQP